MDAHRSEAVDGILCLLSFLRVCVRVACLTPHTSMPLPLRSCAGLNMRGRWVVDKKKKMRRQQQQATALPFFFCLCPTFYLLPTSPCPITLAPSSSFSLSASYLHTSSS
mmetsp:Transcript_29869/g.77095  ORF Transcript_29869/g.77095 Transcript_29869/m.77095 type:complete len:109 (+) Transcript_29869:711-1037(+)